MIKKQILLVKNEIANQTRKVLGIDRRKNLEKRQFLESIFQEQTTGIPREQAMILITNTCIRLRELWKDCGSEEVWKVITDSGYNPPKENPRPNR